MKAIIFLSAAAVLLGACSGTVDNRYYLLSAVPPSDTPAAGGKTIVVSSVHLPGVLDRPELVVRTGAETVDILEFDRWAEPLDKMVPHVLAQDLSFRLSASVAGKDESHLHVVIDEFMTDQGSGARLVGKWWMQEQDQAPTARQEHRFTLTTPTSGSQGRQVAAALSTLLGQLADDIARQ